MITKGESGRDKSGVWDWKIQAALYKIDKTTGPTV